MRGAKVHEAFALQGMKTSAKLAVTVNERSLEVRFIHGGKLCRRLHNMDLEVSFAGYYGIQPKSNCNM